MSSTYKQCLRAKEEVSTSLADARSLRDQWLAATRENPTNLTKKEVDLISKAFKNKLLTVKWDCEDLEEILSVLEGEGKLSDSNEIDEVKRFMEGSRAEISKLMDQLEEVESSNKIFNKHGITTLPNQAAAMTSMIQNPLSRYERLPNNDAEEIQFDKTQLASTQASIFNNALYDHFEQTSEEQHKNFNPSQVFNNLSRPVTNVYMNPNDNEVILDMLETEYYNPPSGLQTGSRFNYTIRKILETDRNRFIGTIAFLFSFPILLLLFMVA